MSDAMIEDMLQSDGESARSISNASSPSSSFTSTSSPIPSEILPNETCPSEPKIGPTAIVKASTISPFFSNHFFEIRPSPLGSFGAFASNDLRRGDVILRERPLLVTEHESFYENFGGLTVDEQNVFQSLCVARKGWLQVPRLRAIWETNCFSISSSLSAIFPHASRFNHACHPVCSVSYAYYSELDCLVMTVCAEHVAQGQEMTISYGDAWTPLMLFVRYGFRCECGACEGVSERDVRCLEPEW